ncbi:hypothetical protein ES703_85049 [subsurface metagenome]
MGYLVLIPMGLFAWLCVKAINYSVGGGAKRGLGILTCPLLGGAIIGIGYWAVFIGWDETVLEGGYWVTYKNTVPIAGWLGLFSGGVFLIIGTIWAAVAKTKWEEEDTSSAVTEIKFDNETIDLDRASKIKIADIRCPKCGSEMVVRPAKKGPNAGRKFYVCMYYPECKGKIPIE